MVCVALVDVCFAPGSILTEETQFKALDPAMMHARDTSIKLLERWIIGKIPGPDSFD